MPDRVARPHLDEGRHLDRLAARLDVRRTQILATRQLPHPVWAARVLGIGRSKLYELQAGILESVHIGACRRIPTDALLALFVVKRPGISGGSEAAGEWSSACTEEVSERVA